jgi:hypothetical protein
VRVAVLVPDLLFGSKVAGMLEAAGHEVLPAGDPAAADAVVADVMEVDPATVPRGGVRVGIFNHTHPEARDRALAAGFDVVVPRSRWMRDGVALVERRSAG